MNTHDIDIHTAIMDVITDVWYRAKRINEATYEVLDLIEADRQRRSEPTAAEISDVVREITGCPDIKSGEKSLVVALGMLFHSCAAPQPAVPSGASTLHSADSGAQIGIRATQPAELVERPLPPLDNLSIAELRELAMRDCSQYSDDDLAIAWELFDRLVEGGRIVDATEPVKSHLRVSYDDKGDCLYVVCDSNEPARSDEDEKGILYRYAESDGRLVGITILDFMGRHAKSPDDASQPAELVEGARVATDPSLPELSIVWHDSPEGVDRAMWEEAAQDAGLSYEDLRDSVSVGQDENGAPVELTHAQTIDAIRNQGCWGFVDTNTGTIHAWAADDADPMLVVHMLAHEIGHMTGEQHPDELQEEMRAEQFGRVAAMAFRMWRQRRPLTIVEGAQ